MVNRSAKANGLLNEQVALFGNVGRATGEDDLRRPCAVACLPHQLKGNPGETMHKSGLAAAHHPTCPTAKELVKGLVQPRQALHQPTSLRHPAKQTMRDQGNHLHRIRQPAASHRSRVIRDDLNLHSLARKLTRHRKGVETPMDDKGQVRGLLAWGDGGGASHVATSRSMESISESRST